MLCSLLHLELELDSDTIGALCQQALMAHVLSHT